MADIAFECSHCGQSGTWVGKWRHMPWTWEYDSQLDMFVVYQK